MRFPPSKLPNRAASGGYSLLLYLKMRFVAVTYLPGGAGWLTAREQESSGW